MSKVRVEKKIGDGILSFETGWMAKQAAACVLCQYQDTIVLNAVTTGPARPGTDFFPLTCDYRERTSAAGKFPGGFIKREGRPTTKETLTSRLIDRPIRPMFADGFLDEVQCQALVLSSDRQNDADVLAMNGVAAALLISSMPFEQAVASVRVGRIDGQFIPFPTHDQLEESDLDLIVSGTDKSVTMIEGFAREMPEDEMMAAIDYSHSVIREVLTLMQELKSRVNPAPCTFKSPPRDAMIDDLRKHFQDQLRTAKMVPGKQDRADAVRAVKELALNTFSANVAEGQSFDTGRFQHAWHDLEQAVVRELILNGTRSDGRDSKTLRPIDCHVGILPRVHGSALFQRGETQALITITLGTNRDEQRVDGLQEEYSKKFMLDYNFPAFSVGECKPNRGPGRREIGHGMLAERSLKPVLPDPDDFPYTVRVISDILESNGSSSMATVCGTTLGLMDAGVKIKNPVAGISIGLVIDGDRWTLLTDIIGDEDHFGDMDFKIAGTPNGITGIQLDLKIRGISSEIIRATMTQSRETRLEILKYMLSAIDQPREEISLHAPRLLTTQIDPEKIGMLIGPGGKNIRAIQEETDTVIEVDDSGKVTIASSDSVMAQKALARVELSTATVQIGKIYDGVVSSIKDFGAFVEILPGRDGLCHISELSSGYVGNVHDVCQVGDEMKVFVIDIDGNDRIKLSRRRALEELGLADEFADPVEEEIVYEDEEIEDDEFVEDDEEFVEGEEVVFVDDEDEFVEDEEGVALEDRPRDDRPREERPREDRPREERPRSDRSRDDRPRSNDRGRTSDRGPSRSGGRPAGDRGGSDRGGSDRGGYRDSRGGGNRSGGGSDRGSSDRGGSDRGGSDRGGSDRGGYRDQRSGSSDRGNFRDDRGGGDRGNSGRGGQGGGQGGGYRGGSSRGGSGGSGGSGGGGGRGRGGNDRNRGGGRGRYDR